MGSRYATHFNPAKTPQRERIPTRSDQVENRAGGFGWEVDKWTRMERFLTLGTEGGTLYVSEKKLTVEAATATLECIREDTDEVLRRIVDVSAGGKAYRNDAAVFALALAIVYGDEKLRAETYDLVPRVCRTFHHLTLLLSYLKDLGKGWSAGLRRAVNGFYNQRSLRNLAYTMTKYRERNGWTQRDVLLQGHVIDQRGRLPMKASAYDGRSALPDYDNLHGNSTQRGAVYGRVIGGEIETFTGEPSEDYFSAMEYLDAVGEAKSTVSAARLAAIIRHHKLPREVVPEKALHRPEIWDALLEDMPITAMIRNLAWMTSVGLIKPLSEAESTIAERIVDGDRLRKGRVHPLQLIAATMSYRTGQSRNLSYYPSPKVLDALDEAYYKSFEYVEPTGKRIVLGVDVSASMASQRASGIRDLSAAEAGAVMAMTIARTEPNSVITFFNANMTGRYLHWGGYRSYRNPLGDAGIAQASISKNTMLRDVLGTVQSVMGGGTDCSLPIQWAHDQNIEADAFLILTDDESWAGSIHPVQAVQMYRKKMGIDAKLVSVAMSADKHTIADSEDSGSLAVVGLSTTTPAAISAFIAE